MRCICAIVLFAAIAAGCEASPVASPLEGAWRSEPFEGEVGNEPARFRVTLTFDRGRVFAENECFFPGLQTALTARTHTAATVDAKTVTLRSSARSEVAQNGVSCEVSLQQSQRPYRVDAEALYLGEEPTPLRRVPPGSLARTQPLEATAP